MLGFCHVNKRNVLFIFLKFKEPEISYWILFIKNSVMVENVDGKKIYRIFVITCTCTSIQKLHAIFETNSTKHYSA